MATIASSTSLPMVGCLALPWRCADPASFGTQKTFSARYRLRLRGRPPRPWLPEASGASPRRVGDVLQEDQPQDDVLILRRIHVVAELVGGQPQLGLESKVGPIAVAFGDCSRLLLAHLARFRFCESCRSLPTPLLAHAGGFKADANRKTHFTALGGNARNPTPDSRQFEVEGGGQPPSSPWECGGSLHGNQLTTNEFRPRRLACCESILVELNDPGGKPTADRLRRGRGG